MSITPVAYQWLDSAHFRKKIPKGADPADWRPVIAVADAEAMVEAALLRWALLYGGPDFAAANRFPSPVPLQ